MEKGASAVEGSDNDVWWRGVERGLVVSAPGRFRWGKQQHEEEVDLFIGIKR